MVTLTPRSGPRVVMSSRRLICETKNMEDINYHGYIDAQVRSKSSHVLEATHLWNKEYRGY